MELVISIDKDTYIKAKEQDIITDRTVVNAIADGVPLDKIRAEMKEHADRLKDSLYGDGMRHCVDIIDKYRAESEG